MLQALPDGAVALIQKPMGGDLAEATRILEICRAKKLKAAVNFQLRFAPMMLALKDAIAKGWLGRGGRLRRLAGARHAVAALGIPA